VKFVGVASCRMLMEAEFDAGVPQYLDRDWFCFTAVVDHHSAIVAAVSSS
jgi:hypothetical protein